MMPSASLPNMYNPTSSTKEEEQIQDKTGIFSQKFIWHEIIIDWDPLSLK